MPIDSVRMKMGLGLMGKLGRAWVGAWVVHGWVVVVMVWMMWLRWDKCGGILLGLVWLDLGIGGGLVGDGEEGFGVVSGSEMNTTTTSPINRLVAQIFNLCYSHLICNLLF